MGLFLNEMILTKNNHAQEKVFKDLDVEKNYGEDDVRDTQPSTS